MVSVRIIGAGLLAASVLAVAAHAQSSETSTNPDLGLSIDAFEALAPTSADLAALGTEDGANALLAEPLSTFDPSAPLDMGALMALEGAVRPSLDLEDRFTLRGFGFDTIASFNDMDMVEFNAGAKWGFTLGVNSRAGDYSGFDGMRAGAFLNITPRMRLGGSFGVGETSTEAVGLDVWGENREQALKIESAFRF